MLRKRKAIVIVMLTITIIILLSVSRDPLQFMFKKMAYIVGSDKYTLTEEAHPLDCSFIIESNLNDSINKIVYSDDQGFNLYIRSIEADNDVVTIIISPNYNPQFKEGRFINLAGDLPIQNQVSLKASDSFNQDVFIKCIGYGPWNTVGKDYYLVVHFNLGNIDDYILVTIDNIYPVKYKRN